MSKSTHRRLLLAAVESTYGTFATIAGTDALLVSNLDFQPLDPGLIDRELLRQYFGHTEKIVGQRVGMASFDVEIAGSGTAGTAPRWGRILQCCGFGEAVVSSTVEYTPAMTNIKGVSLDFNNDGLRNRLRGCRGNATFNLAAGEIPKISFELMGFYVDAADEAQLTPTFGNQATPVICSGTNTTPVEVFGYASACMESFSLALNNEMPLKRLMGCTDQYQITNHLPSGDVVVELPTIAAKNYFAQLLDRSRGEISFQHGQTAGNIVDITMEHCSISGPITYNDSDGVQMANIPYEAESTAANNHLKIVVK
jgi:hypothetical protein